MKIKDLNNTIINSMIMTGTVIDCKEGYMEITQQSLSEPTLTISVPSTVTVGNPVTITVTASVVGDITVYINQEYYETSIGQSTMSFTYTPQDTFTIEAYFSSTQGVSVNTSQEVVLIDFTPAVQSFNPQGQNYNDVFQEWLYNNGYSANAEYTTMEEALNVEEIPNEAFYVNTSLTHMDELRYFNNIKRIGANAFDGCTNLTSITMPEEPNYYTYIYPYAFSNTGLLYFDSGISGVMIQSQYAGHQFMRCQSLIRVILRNDLDIPPFAFADCGNLEEITFVQWTQFIFRNAAFAGCERLEHLHINGEITYIDKQVFFGCFALDNVSLSINSNQTKIQKDSFYYCTTLSSTVIPSNVSLIDDGAYCGCTNLSIIYSYAVVPPSVNVSGESHPFYNVPRAATVYVPQGSGNAYRNADVWREFNIVEMTEIPESWAVQNTNPGGEKYNPQLQIWSHSNGYSAEINYTTKTEAQAVTMIEDNAFNNNTNLTSINELQYFTNISIVNDYAFRGTSNLTTAILPPSVTDIYVGAFQNSAIYVINPRLPYNPVDYTKGASNVTASNVSRYAFAGCANLTSVTFGSNTTTVGASAFEGCLILRNVYGEDSGWISVQNNTFKNCSMLKNIHLPSTVTMLLNNVVDGCTALEAIYCYATTPPSLTTSTFTNMAADVTLYVPYESLSAYQNSSWANYFSSILPISTPVTYACQSIDSDLINYNPAFQEWLYNNGYSANSGYTTTTEALNLTEIPSRAFEGNTDLTDLYVLWNFPNLVRINNNAFRNCTGLYTANIPESVTYLGATAFEGCTRLGVCYMNESQIESIHASTFVGCSEMTQVTLPSTLTYIGEWAFHNCTNLITVQCEATTPPEVYSGAFDDTSNIRLYVPSASVSAYQNSTYWQGFRSYNAI